MISKIAVLLVVVFGLAAPARGQPQESRTEQGLGAVRPHPAEVDLPDDGVKVRMESQLHLPVVEVMIGEDGPYRFGIDTGASGQLSVSTDLALDLALNAIDEITVSDGTGRNMATRAVYEVPSLWIGDSEFVDLQSISGDYNRGSLGSEPIDGILGIGLFNGLTFTLDYPGQEVRISRQALPEPDGEEIFAMDAEEAVPTIEWTLGGKTVRAHVDARNMGAIMVPQSLADKLPLDGEPAKVGEARTQFNVIPILAATLREDLKLGRHVIATPRITFTELYQAANIGSRVMEQFEVTIDQKNNRIQFHRETEEPIQLRR